MIKIISVVSNDIVTDNRIHKIACTLSNNGYEVLIVGRKLKKSLPLLARPYSTKRLPLLFNKGPLFYAGLNIRLLVFLLKTKADVILSNDLDTLLACSLASRLKRKKLVFDSHELFPEVPELVHRPLIRKIWLFLEKQLVKKVEFGFTVSESIASFYKNRYGVTFETIRNVNRFRPDHEFSAIRKDTSLKIIIYQGALNLGRGIELAIKSMQYLENAKLWIIGDGDIKTELVKLTTELGLSSKIEFKGRVSIEDLWNYTPLASVGISLEENLGLNYQYALPNKLFDYIQARIPVIVSDLPEMSAIVKKHKIGSVLVNRTPQNLADTIRGVFDNIIASEEFNFNILRTAQELCWEKEEEKLVMLFKRVRTSI